MIWSLRPKEDWRVQHHREAARVVWSLGGYLMPTTPSDCDLVALLISPSGSGVGMRAVAPMIDSLRPPWRCP
jgi:hypothetical protein